MTAFMIAATHKSSGKTTISIGLAAAFKAQGLSVQTFKKGPDYIDPMWLKAASGKACYNLDFNSMNEKEIANLFAKKASGNDIVLLEANKGLFDGVDLYGKDSNAQLAKILKLPVILVIDAIGMTRGIAPLLLGYQAFDSEVNIAGVILNKVGGARHEAKLRAAIKEYTNFVVIGAIKADEQLDIGERHLGLTTPSESKQQDKKISILANAIAKQIDLSNLRKIAKTAPKFKAIKSKENPTPNLRIAIAKDRAFGFYYEDDLEEFAKLGAKLIEFDCLHDNQLPKNINGLFIGGGFPETQMQELSANKNLRSEIKLAIEAGLPTYAECGGLMYLCNKITWHKKSYPMVGIIAANTKMNAKPQGRGYAVFENLSNHIWVNGNDKIKAHEFHYASLEDISPEIEYARKITRGHGINGSNDAIIIHNLIAGFCHLRNSKSNPWVKQFVDFILVKKL